MSHRTWQLSSKYLKNPEFNSSSWFLKSSETGMEEAFYFWWKARAKYQNNNIEQWESRIESVMPTIFLFSSHFGLFFCCVCFLLIGKYFRNSNYFMLNSCSGTLKIMKKISFSFIIFLIFSLILTWIKNLQSVLHCSDFSQLWMIKHKFHYFCFISDLWELLFCFEDI